MKRERVNSTSIRSIGYEADTKVLEIELVNGGIYQYSAVPAKVHEDLINASSTGRYYSKYIRETYKYRKIK